MRLKINKNLLIFLFPIITLLFVLSSQSASAYTCTWTGTSSTAWATAGNWSGCNSTIPQTTDDVVINVASANQPLLDLTGGKTINSLSIGSSAVSTLTLSNGLVDIDVNKLTITNNLTVGGSGTITSTANTTAQTHSVNMSVGGNVDIATNGKIDVTGKGLSGGAGGAANASGGNGNTSGTGGGGGGTSLSGCGGGGGYGGIGGSGDPAWGGAGLGGIENNQNNIHQPIALGSGGGGAAGYTNVVGAAGGAGGGAIKLIISGTLTLNSGGFITANGNNGSNSGGNGGGGGAGSGGSIWVQVGAISGSGTIRVNGGAGGFGGLSWYGGGGSGGRIAITGYSADSSVKQAYGGLGYNTIYGGAGSIYTKSSSATYGDLTFNNNSQNSPSARTITTSYGILDFNNISFNEGTAGFTNTGATLNIYGTFSSSSSNTIDKTFINSGTINLYSSGTFAISATANNSGTINANSITTLNVSNVITNSGSFVANALENLNLSASMAMDFGKYTLPSTLNMTINSGGILTHTANTTARTYYIDLSLANLTINSGGYVNVDGKGLSGGAGGIYSNGSNGTTSGAGGGSGGISTSGGGGGGGYGGIGGNGQSGVGAGGSGGIENGQASTTQPIILGSGGGGGASANAHWGGGGGKGGGAIKLIISGALTLNSGGVITANGNNGSAGYSVSAGDGGGGSGGSIWISAGTITGSGTVNTNGGNGSTVGYDGGGGAGGRISLAGIGTAGFVKGSGFSMTPTATGGTGYASGGTGSIYYNVSGTQTSSVMDFTVARDFTTLAYNKTTTADSISTPTLTVDARAGNATDTNDSSWTAWQTNISSNVSDNLNPFDNKRYVQYRLNLASNNAIQSPKPYNKPTANPSLQDISFGYLAYVNKTLTSSKYNSSSTANTLASIAWDETLNTNTNIRFQMKTSADDSTWTDWLGPDGTNGTYFDDISSGCSKAGSVVTCNINSSTALGDGAISQNDQYYQYKAYLETTDGLATPTLNSVTVTYVVNANPIIEDTPTAIPNSSGNVDINYAVRDPDSESGHITPTFKYSLDGGSSWTATTASCFLGAQDLTAKDVNADVGETPGEFLDYSATWDPSCEIGKPESTITASTFEIDAQVQVIANDGQVANYEDTNNSINFVLDTKPPVISNLTLDASVDLAQINITSTDDSTYEMKIAQGTDLTDCETNLALETYTTYNATPTITPDQDPVTICLQLQDQYSNTSTVSSTNSPETPTAFMVQDTTNILTTPNEFRLFIAWKVSTDPDFNRYELYRSTDNSTFSKIFETYTQSTNSYPDNTVVGDQLYYYKVKTIDSNNNQSFYSTTVQAKANGIQDYGEGGGGTSSAPPVISDVQIPPSPIFTSQATITWSTDVFSNSTVGYSITPGSFTTEVGSDTMYDNTETGHYGPHTVVLTNLTPDTDYYFQVKSMGTNQITGTDDNTTHLGYHFKTLPGPKITTGSVLVSKTTNTSATINWITDVASSSKVNYSTFSDMSNAENFLGTNQDSTNHEVTVTSLLQGTKYYFYVQSIHNGDTATDNNQYPINSYYSFTTTQDLIAPTITFNQDNDITNITDTTAKVSWTTNEASSDILEYGLDTSYGTTLTNDNLNTNHIFDLENLTKDTTYYIRLTSTDANSNPATAVGSFTTTDSTDYDAPVITHSGSPSTVTDTTAIINWTTNEYAKGKVYYREAGELTYQETAFSNFGKEGTITITSLSPNVSYEYYLSIEDLNANPALSGSAEIPFDFTTQLTQSDHPNLTNPGNPTVSQYSDSEAVVTFSANTTSTSKLCYSSTAEIDNMDTCLSALTLTDPTRTHYYHLTGLTADTVYYVRTKTTDSEDGSIAFTSSNVSFTTQLTQSDHPNLTNPGNPTVSQYSDSEAVVTFSANTTSTSKLCYSSTAEIDNMDTCLSALTLTDPTRTHYYHLTGLTADTVYYIRTKTTDSEDGSITFTSSNVSFTTQLTQSDHPNLTNPGNPTVSQYSDTEAVVTFSANTTSTSKLCYSSTAEIDNMDTCLSALTLSDPTRTHYYHLTGLTADTVYYVRTKTTDSEDGSIAFTSSNVSFTTQLTQSDHPNLTNPGNPTVSQYSDTEAVVTFSANTTSTSKLCYSSTAEIDNMDTCLSALTLTDPTRTHYYHLTGLTANTIYYIRTKTTDSEDGSITFTSSNVSFTTRKDSIGPTITNVEVSDITYNQAVVSWMTGEASDSRVEYITETGGDFSEALGFVSNAMKNTTAGLGLHSVTLQNLNSVTTYYYQVKSMDVDGDTATSKDGTNGYTFTTLSPTTDEDTDGEGDQLTDIMTQIQAMIDNYYFTEQEIQDALAGLYSISITSSGPSVDITGTTATITWTTNRPAIGKIVYWQDTDNEDTAVSQSEVITIATTDHEVIIKNLNANTTYNYYAYSEGLLDAVSQSENKSFSTGDTAQLSGISITNLTLNSADISWTTTGSIDSSTLEYGESIKYGKSDKGKTSSNLHTVNLTNLKENTTYHLRVSATDDDGQTLTSDDYSFTTVSLPIISNVTIKDIQIESAVINWQTNVKTDSRVEFKKDGETKGTTSGELEAVTDHSFTLTNLFPGTRYTFKVSSKDTFNNESSSEELAFTTAEDLNPPIITNVKSDTTVFPGKEAQIQTIISWNTDKDSNSILAYRQGVEKDYSLVDQLKNPDTTKIENWKLIKKSDLTKSHLFVLTDLKPASVYQFRTASFDKHNNVSVSENYSLLTPTKQQSVLDLIISNFESTFGWVKRIGN